MTTTRRTLLAGMAAAGGAFALAGCGTEDPAGDPAANEEEFAETGPITYAAGKDTTGKMQEVLDAWNEEHPDEEVTMVELPESADEQRSGMIQNFQVESDEYTVLGLDVIWTAEFAANQWIVPLPEDTDTSAYMESAVETATYFEQLYGIPFTSNAFLMTYRTDLLEAVGAEVPTTFEEMWSVWDSVKDEPEAEGMNCYGAQFAKYEGLTCNVTQAANSSGGSFFDDEGNPTADSDAAVKGLTTIVEGFENGYIPEEALTYKEEESRQAFQDGKLMFATNWPYVYAMAEADDGSSEVAGKFDVAPIPGVDGPGTSTLGGLNLGISAFASNKGTALEFIKYMTSKDVLKDFCIATARVPAMTELFDDEDIIEALPYTPVLKEGTMNAKGRPQAVKYGDVTKAIQDNCYAALDGSKDVAAALADTQSALEGLAE